MKNCLSSFGVRLRAFSLVEMLMALLVASLLMAALAPVMTKKINEGITISVEGTIPGKKTKTHEITYGSAECPAGTGEVKTDSDGSQYCEGEFVVPTGYNGNMKVTVVGAGGGGSAASTAGYTEYKNPGDGQTFLVPPFVNKVEATLIGGGAAGGAGGKREIYKDWTNGGMFIWDDIPADIRNTYVKVTACGGGGGGGGLLSPSDDFHWISAGGGGSGGYVKDVVKHIPSSGNISFVIGGGGGHGGSNNACGGNGRPANGGGGGGECGVNPNYGKGHGEGGAGGTKNADAVGYTLAKGGSGGMDGTLTSISALGQGGLTTIAGNGGNAWGVLIDAVSMGGGSGGVLGGGGGGASGEGGAGGGGGATRISGFASGDVVLASGGGGGVNVSGGNYQRGGGGGGGGGTGGGAGGFYIHANPGRAGFGGAGGENGVWGLGGVISDLPSEWANNCSGGQGQTGYVWQTDGKDGAVRIYYAANASGGSGGGGGAIVPYQEVLVNPLETLVLNIGQRAAGGTTGGYKSDGSFVGGYAGSVGAETLLKRNVDILLRTNTGHWTHQGVFEGGCPNVVCRSGSVFDGKSQVYANSWNGASNVNGLASDNRPWGSETAGAVNSNGGRGGYVNVFGEQFCTPGAGGTVSHPDGYDAAGYGCGGGGGSRGGKGGSGSGGYARISWNEYWDIASNTYKYAENGGGGGGASGNVMVYILTGVKSGQKIKIRIGKGGTEGYTVSNAQSGEFVSARKGGDTVFALGTGRAIKAGGGGGGIFPKIEDGVLKNGEGGAKSSLCSAENKDYYKTPCSANVKTNCCIKGATGSNAEKAKGGSGANLESYGMGGGVRNPGSGTTDGLDANISGYGAGGGGASLRDLGVVNISETTANPTRGGAGSNGKILLEWQE